MWDAHYEPTRLCKVVYEYGRLGQRATSGPFRIGDQIIPWLLWILRECGMIPEGSFPGYLPFHERFVNDKQFGGFLCSVRPTGELVSDEKRVWFEGRGIWVYSFLYNHLAREQKYLDTAAASVRLLARSKPHDPEEFRPKALHRDCSPAGLPILRWTATCLSQKDWRSSPENPVIASIGTKRGKSW